MNDDALASQDGTLASLAGNLDLCTFTSAWNGASLPAGTLVNQLAICAYTLKNYNGSIDLTGSIIGMTVSDGTYTYSVSRAATAGPIYVALRPTSSANIEITATADGSHYFVKSLAGKTYAAGNGYNISLRTSQVIQYTSPTLQSTLTFNGSWQSLVNAGTVDYGTISYSTDGGASWSSYATAYAPGTYTIYYKVEPSVGYTGGVGSTLLGNVTMNKAQGWINVSGGDEDWDQEGSMVLTITSSHGGAISVVASGGFSAVYNGVNTVTVTSNKAGGDVTIYCAETDYYTSAEWESDLYVGIIPV